MTRADVTGHLVAAVAEVLPGVPVELIGGDRHLRDLGADSVERVEIIVAVLDRLGLDEPLSSFTDLPHVEAMVDFLCERSSR
ncbi:acyl carrier protein [Paractinoplanes atraurantiacus]|uniref:Polyketide biosynthesis acyl carrier protein n=1 Tax=Paractinoplanes atraurantiacus TaxID=1036182 RepID=A0A285GLE5_9ACTN|nr:phosphopantetheine-binding protein [Actinoplanes atraurantiacus]SNY24450.1 polyketide biosynthesis acyl carrier protein [Actinoplanes atraurantiacus]